MDKRDWGWVKQHMPGVTALLAEYRAFGEGLHLDECWRRGVQRGEAGWFFAREGPICLGTPFDGMASPLLIEWAKRDWQRHGMVLMLAPLVDGSECRRLTPAEREAWAIVGARAAKEARRRQEAEAAHGAH